MDDDSRRARCVMVLGTSSGAGKSLVATALCRWYARRGLEVAPFKAQNMSNNARVVDGGEIGAAQYFQALAARAEPHVDMNPVLLKPERDDRSQVVLLGRVDERLGRTPWRERGDLLWPHAAAALDRLRATHDVVVIEGAGSPAEINLRGCDIANLRTLRHANARALLVADIDRGGAFAHLYGTWLLLDGAERARIAGFVLNKFRGDAALLDPAPRLLEEMTGVPTVATIPMLRDHGLPEEDGVFEDGGSGPADASRRIAIVAYPHVGNLDEFQPLTAIDDVRVVWARDPAQLAGADWIVLPGSKDTADDLRWLRARGLDRAVAAHAAAGGAVLGICGGLQMLGEALIDPGQIDGNAAGLGLLPLVTRFEPEKTVERVRTRFGAVTGAWGALSQLEVAGYQIHNGRTGTPGVAQHPAMAAAGNVARAVLPDALGWQNPAGNVLATYVHGLFEDPAVLRALFGAAAVTRDTVFDRLADDIDRAFAPGVLEALLKRD